VVTTGAGPYTFALFPSFDPSDLSNYRSRGPRIEQQIDLGHRLRPGMR
jgi:hypothetical protein